jgi:hypothetical protein
MLTTSFYRKLYGFKNMVRRKIVPWAKLAHSKIIGSINKKCLTSIYYIRYKQSKVIKAENREKNAAFYPDEAHGLAVPPPALDAYRCIMNFSDRHLKDSKEKKIWCLCVIS